MIKKRKNILILVTLFILLVLCVFNTEYVIDTVIEYTTLFLKRFFPVSFVFFTISNLLIEYNIIQFFQKIFRLKSNYIFLYLLSMISGFPSGAIYIRRALEKDLISSEDANRIIMFCHFPNPLFVINSVGLILNSKYIAFIILTSIYLGNLILLIFLYRKTNTNYEIKLTNDFSNNLVTSIMKSTKIIITIYGISLLFIIISSFIILFIKNTFLYVLIYGFFDLTKGIYSSILINNILIRSLIILLFISFGSFSIHMQTKSILTDTCINYNSYVIGRIIATIISILIFLILMLFY